MALCIEKFFKLRFSKIIKVLATFMFISFTWIFFRAETFSDAWKIIKGIFTLQNGIRQPFMWSFIALGLLIISEIVAILKAYHEKVNEVRGFCPILDLNTIVGLTTFFTFLGLILSFAFMGENPFVYFQF